MIFEGETSKPGESYHDLLLLPKIGHDQFPRCNQIQFPASHWNLLTVAIEQRQLSNDKLDGYLRMKDENRLQLIYDDPIIQ